MRWVLPIVLLGVLAVGACLHAEDPGTGEVPPAASSPSAQRYLDRARAALAAGDWADAVRSLDLALVADCSPADRDWATAELAKARERLAMAPHAGGPTQNDDPRVQAARTALWSLVISGRSPKAADYTRYDDLRNLVADDPLLGLVEHRLVPAWAARVGADRNGRWAAALVGIHLLRLRYVEPGQITRSDGSLLTNPRGFWIGETELTLAAADALRTGEGSDRRVGQDMALTGLELADWQKLLRELANRLGNAPVRLPTAAEWTYAALGGQGDAWLPGFVGRDDACYDRIAPEVVGRYQPNANGLFDVHGGVWELVSRGDGFARVGGSWRSRRADCALDAPRALSSASADPLLGARVLIEDQR